MKECPVCKRVYEDQQERCIKERSPLRPSLPGSITINQKYTLQQCVGQGTLGPTFQAIDSDGNEVIIKTISAENNALSTNIKEIFLKEIKSNNETNHPDLVKVLDYGETSQQILYLVTEALAGFSLKELLKQEKRLELGRALDLIGQIGAVLDHMHKKGRTHQDLKPSNIYIVYNEEGKEEIKLLDYGIGKIKWKEIEPAYPAMRESLLELPYYQSPEQFNNGNISATSEVYSLGVIFYEMICGKPPFTSKNYEELKQDHQHHSPASIWTIRRDLPEDIDTFVMLALSKQAESRIQTVGAFLSCLRIASTSKAKSRTVTSEFNIQSLASATLLNMPAVSANAIYVPDPDDYLPPAQSSESDKASLKKDYEQVVSTVTKVMEISQLPTVFGRQRTIVTVGIMTGLLLAALEVTVVATAMPKVVATLGGFNTYSWVFSIYLLTSTIGMPIWGKLSDLYGRRVCYQLGLTIFIVGSLLCGMASSMNQLIAFRAIQGLGGGALIPLALTVIGDIYTLQERPKMQAVISAIWGFSSIVGPLVGGFLTDYSSWRWIFLMNLPLGILTFIIISLNMKEPRLQILKPKIDLMGAITLTVSIGLLLLGCLREKGGMPPWISNLALIIAPISLAIFIYVEKNTSEPLLPLWLFKEKIFLATVLGNLFLGCVLFGSMPFITLFAQGVLNSTATKAGTVLMPLILGWVVVSVIGSKIMLKSGFRNSVIGGMIGVVFGFGLLVIIVMGATRTQLYMSMSIIGMGMGLALTALIIAVQTSVPKNQLGVVTSSALFFRNIGGSLGATIMGALLSWSISNNMLSIPQTVVDSGKMEELKLLASNVNLALDPNTKAMITSVVMDYFRLVLAGGIKVVFIFCFIVTIGAFVTSLIVPKDNKISI